jgi:hypothetical protein
MQVQTEQREANGTDRSEVAENTAVTTSTMFVCLSVQKVASREARKEFPRNFILLLGRFTKISPHTPVSIKI